MFKKKIQMSNEMKEKLKVMHFKYAEKCLKQKNDIIYAGRFNKGIQEELRII
uniref:Uncharacterized protein n=1 Tax=viral metagenome TaxID=1070528 RepID=A0A6C0HSN6_9ZZZZ